VHVHGVGAPLAGEPQLNGNQGTLTRQEVHASPGQNDARQQQALAQMAGAMEKVLTSELSAREDRRVNTLMKLATMPGMKTLEQFDWGHAGGAPKAQILELAHLAFVQRAEVMVLLGPGPGASWSSSSTASERAEKWTRIALLSRGQ